MKKIRFAIIGTSSIVSVHAQAIKGLDNAELTLICGRNPVQAKELAAKFDCDWSDDFPGILNRQDIDAVSICTPSGLHADMGIMAAQNGKHVIVEKPIDISLEKADALIEACKKQDVKLGVIFQRRYSDGVAALKELLNTGKLGRVVYGGCYIKLYRSQEYYADSPSHSTWKMAGGGILMNQGIHYIDMLQYLAGPIIEVHGQCMTMGHQNIEVEDTASAVIKFKSGAMGVIEGTTCAYPGLVSRVDVYGTEGSAVIENDKLTFVQLKSGYAYRAASDTEKAGVSSPDIGLYCHRMQYQDFISAFSNHTEPCVNGEAGRATLETILAIYKSAFTGKTIRLPMEDSIFLQDLKKAGGFVK